jgi:hypothetical protein
MLYVIQASEGEALTFVKQQAEARGDADWWPTIERLVLLAKLSLMRGEPLGDEDPDHRL